MPGLVPGIHVLTNVEARKPWRVGSSAAMTKSESFSSIRPRLVELAIFGRGDAGGGLEGAIKRSERLETRIHRNGDHGHLGLRGISQSGLCLLDPVIIEEDIEIAITELLVDQAPQFVFGHGKLCCQRPD